MTRSTRRPRIEIVERRHAYPGGLQGQARDCQQALDDGPGGRDYEIYREQCDAIVDSPAWDVPSGLLPLRSSRVDHQECSCAIESLSTHVSIAVSMTAASRKSVANSALP
jgi:hypothetical protein